MTLQELIKDLSEHQRQYLIRRVAGLTIETSRELVGITKGTYNNWFHNKAFAVVHNRLPELQQTHRNEAIQILRRQNQLEAVLLERKIISKMKEEIESGQLNLCRTHLAREVYSKLMSDLDVVPQVSVASWQQRIQHIFQGLPSQNSPAIEGEVLSLEEGNEESQTASS